MNKNETIADIRKETEARFREFIEKHQPDSFKQLRVMQEFNHAFDRIEAAAMRERVEVSVRAATSAINLTEEKWKGESGLREAVELCDKIINDGTIVCNCDIVDEARAKIRAALALFSNSPKNENSDTAIITEGKQELNANSKSAQIELCNLAKLRKAASNALAELKLFRKIHDARLHFCDIVHVGNAKLYLHDALALFTDSPENENTGAGNVTAGKQEMPGNAAKLREALETVRKYVKETTPDRVMLGVIEVWCDEALAAPTRNCDVGTAEKQEKRFTSFCLKDRPCAAGGGVFCAFECPLNIIENCRLKWAQMPYESEAADESK